MRTPFWLSAFSAATLALLSLAPGGVRAGSWFGPCCYGASYAYEYPNRAHNVFGCGPCTQCSAWHPTFKRHWQRKHQATAAVAAPFEYATPTPAPSVVSPAPVQAASVQSVVQPLPSGTVNVTNPSARPPF